MEPIIENAHRIGKRGTSEPRQNIAKLLYRPQRKEVLVKCRRALHDSPFFITEDLTPEDFKKKASLRPVMSAAFKEGETTSFHKWQAIYQWGGSCIMETSHLKLHLHTLRILKEFLTHSLQIVSLYSRVK